MKMFVGEKRRWILRPTMGKKETLAPLLFPLPTRATSILSFPDSSPISFDEALEKALASASPHVSVQDCLADRIQQITSGLLKSTERYFQKRDAFHNSSLANSLLRTPMRAATCCTMFRDCAMDLRTEYYKDKDVGNRVLFNMVDRAGKEIRSLKLGRVTRGSSPSVGRGTCLLLLSDYDGFHGLTNKYVTGTIDTTTCPSLIKFVTYSPNLTSLTLINFPLTDEMAGILAESLKNIWMLFAEFSYAEVPESVQIVYNQGDLGHSCKDSPLKTLILRNCFNLEEREVLQLCESLVTGGFKSIQHIDVSNKRGLLAVGGKKRSYKPKNQSIKSGLCLKISGQKSVIMSVVEWMKKR
ncbi:unnamed protein product [Arabis nemorensis]|uniref:Uncharacterized protein n=1 Tax=Arabis nemorensis TaxID=586526 RepID=A0A565B7I0_9BRAS|nr:unnamed protein product [Arabis nemorensis]